MPREFVCAHGHRWTSATDANLPGLDGLACPHCGAAAETVYPGTDVPEPKAHASPATTISNTPAEGPSDPRAIAGYVILSELGSGGMGVVYKARQLRPNRLVALKLLRGGDADEQARFRAEGEAMARLSHANILQVFEIGEQNGRLFLAMEFADSGSLESKQDGSPLPPREAAELVRTLALAVQHAHERGVVHRDLKPANLLLTTEGTIKVADFGIAKRLDIDLRRTRTGAVIGTPVYMAPEQARGHAREVGPRTDVYALGVILYELLTGRVPFRGANSLETLEQICSQEPVPPSRLQPRLPRDLESVCLKCLEKAPGQRYGSAAELGDDLGRLLRGEPVRARPLGSIRRGWRWCRRNPTVAGLLATVALVLVGGITVSTWQAIRARAAEGKATFEKGEAEKKRREAERDRHIATAVLEFLQKDLLDQADIRNQPIQDRKLGEPEGANPNITVVELLDRASRELEGKFKGQPETEAAIRLTVGNAYRALGKYPQAQRHLERSVALREEYLGADHLDTLIAKYGLAWLYDDQGNFGKAEPLYLEVIRQREKKLGTDHPDTLDGKSNLAALYNAEGKYDKAEPLFVEVLQRSETKLGGDHLKTLISKNNLAQLYYVLGKDDKAESLFLEVIPLQEKKWGADHPDTLISKNNLAALYMRQEKIAKAEPLLKEVLDHREKRQGPDHPSTLISKSNLAMLYNSQQKYGKAEALLLEVIRLREKKLGVDHPSTLTSKNNLAAVYDAQKKLNLAGPLYMEVLKGREKKLGPNHLSTLASKNNLGRLYQDQGNYTGAEPLLEQAFSVASKTVGLANPQTRIFFHNLVNLYDQWGRPEKAQPLLQQRLDHLKARAKGDPVAIADAIGELGANLARQKKYAEAEPLLVQGYEELVKRQHQIPASSRGVHLKQALERLIQLHTAAGNKEGAAKWRKKLEDTRQIARDATKPTPPR